MVGTGLEPEINCGREPTCVGAISDKYKVRLVKKLHKIEMVGTGCFHSQAMQYW